MELLVVVAIIATLVGLLLPAVQSARESSRRATCANNLKQLAMACQSHVTALGHYPTGGWDSAATTLPMISPDRGADWRQPGGWCFTLLPYFEKENVYMTGTAGFNLPVPELACPTRRGTSIGAGGQVMTDYAGNRGSWATSPPTLSATDSALRDTTFGMPAASGTIPSAYPSTQAEFDSLQTAVTNAASLINEVQVTFATGTTGTTAATGGVIFVGSSLPPARIRDGASNTYLFAEKYVPQAEYNTTNNVGYDHVAYSGDSPDTLRGGHRLPEGDGTPWENVLQGCFGGPHRGLFNAAFCDGSVRAIDALIDAQTHFLLAAREDRQAFRPPD